jgi:hypothetical protein
MYPEVSNGCDPCYLLQNHTYMTDVFGTFLPNIYLFLKTRLGNLKSNFQGFQELMNKYAKELCICNSKLMVFNFRQN